MEHATSVMPTNVSDWITKSVLNAHYAQLRISVALICHLGAMSAAKGGAQAAQMDSMLKMETARPVLLSKDARICAVATKNALNVSKGFSKITALANGVRQ